jgi:hypothetical protein
MMKEEYCDDFEMPCMCDCGEWFDLNDGYRSNKSNKVICDICHHFEKKDEEIKDIAYQLECEHISFNHARTELKRLGLNPVHYKSKATIIKFADDI